METFLKMVADDLRRRYGYDLSHTAVVFPNKRAGLFFNEELPQEEERPIWSPAYLTISELFQELSSLRTTDTLLLVCELYEHYRAHTRTDEAIDNFYSWGEMLLNDFDDMDKNRIQAQSLFSNLNQLRKLGEENDFLTEEQVKAIRQFFHNFSAERQTELKTRFLQVWEVMGNIYQDFRKALQEQGIAYEGMLQRTAVEDFDAKKLRYERYVFVGFNLLNRVESSLFDLIKENKEVLFYWDYDIFYTGSPYHEAGFFLRDNLKRYPNALPEEYFNRLQEKKQITYISAATDNIQARYLPEWLASHPESHEADNAVVLCDESLLQPVLHSLPPDLVKNLNITMGFPLSQTPVYSLLQSLVYLQIKGYDGRNGRFTYQTAAALLQHPYLIEAVPETTELLQRLKRENRFFPTAEELQKGPVLSYIFTPQSTPLSLIKYLSRAVELVAGILRDDMDRKGQEPSFDLLLRESLFKAYTLTNRFICLLEKTSVKLQSATLCNLLLKVCASATLPFKGEPVEGLQIMGLLETRNLDFKNLLMLSVNEGQMPKGGNDASFIPYHLRKAFGLTTIDHRNSIYAYYFYRLLQRARSITLLYNNSADGIKNGECSRYMLQYQIESGQNICHLNLQASQKPLKTEMLTVEKTPEVMSLLLRRFNGEKIPISPTALNTYLDCPLKFYLRFIARIKPADETESEINSALFGSIFHDAARRIYDKLSAGRKSIQAADIAPLLKDDIYLYSAIDQSFNVLFFQNEENALPDYNGDQYINREVIKTYLKRLLIMDQNYAPFTYIGSEYPVSYPMNFTVEGTPLSVSIGGTIDRIDRKDDTLYIVDYKTGGRTSDLKEVRELFTPSEKRAGYILQTFLYASALTLKPIEKKTFSSISPVLLYIHRSSATPREGFVVTVNKQPVTDFSIYFDEFTDHLQVLLKEIYDRRKPFIRTENQKVCQYCDYKELCHR